MKKKKCITLVSQFVVFILIIASTVLYPFGFGKLEAATLNNTSGGSPGIVQGDINYDGLVNSIDFAHIRMYLLGMSNSLLSEENVSIADLNMDKEINSIDLGIMRGFLLGKISGFPKGSASPTVVPTVAATPTPKASTTPVPSSTDDFTNSISKASYALVVGEDVNGMINYEGDKDYLTFQPSVDGRYRVDIVSNPDTIVGFLYVEKVEGLDSYYSSFKTYTSDKGCYVEQNLLCNTKYYLGIKNINGVSSLDSYTIKISKVN
ncbi:dockerin type I repeat-containing protein [Acetivibrio cellulolyticus]|uniref:dockerin type I repeat-containing protein n=1 Tax=Acetivibrio cellulolyticus TaxID=35830 RepID=UPI0001E2CC2B|nr:dockerin type I repeat-containing protein [Acetivibrio cellulolyticus]